MFKKEIYIERREILKKSIKNGLIIIPGNQDSPRDAIDNNYPFEQDSTFIYYFGINLPNLIGVINIENNEEYIFGNEASIDDIIWCGETKSLKSFAEDCGINKIKPLNKIKKYLNNNKIKNIHFLPQHRDRNIMVLSSILDVSPYVLNEKASLKLIQSVISQRNKKSQEEIAEIEKAVNVTRLMHIQGMKSVAIGKKEYEIVADIEHITAQHNCKTSFQTIFTRHGEILHNHNYNSTLQNGDLVLLDCGAKTINGYCGDMASVFPVNGKFNERQKNIYNLLLKMFKTAKDMLKPGISYKTVHLEVCKTLAKGLIELGIMKGDFNEIVACGAHALFMPHGLGHMLGLDVHDMENLGEDNVGYGDEFERSTQFGLKSLRLARTLKSGYVFTVEPGIYFIPELIKKWKNENKFINYLNYEIVEEYLDFGGMRFERDFLITEDGCRILGDYFPSTINEIEDLMKNS